MRRKDLAEGVGFEPTEACTSHAFEACPFGHSGILPGGRLSVGPIQSLKNSSGRADNPHVNVDLLEGSATGGPFRVWHLIDASRRRLLTGELVLETSPRTNIYLRDGEVYFAERATDGGLGVRLLVEGVITRAQLQRGSLLVSGVEHLGRLFDRDQTVERGPVELCVELMTEELLVTVGDEWVEDFKFVPFKLHPSGIDRWMPRRVEVVYRQESDADAALVPSAADVEFVEAEVAPAPQPAPVEVVEVVAEPVEVVAEPEPIVAEVEVVAEPVEVVAEPVEVVAEPVVAEPEPIVAEVAAIAEVEVEVAVAEAEAEVVAVEAEVVAVEDVTEPEVVAADEHPMSAPLVVEPAVIEPVLPMAAHTAAVPPPPVTGEHPVVLAVPLPTREVPVVPAAQLEDETAAADVAAYRPSQEYVPLAPPPPAPPAPAPEQSAVESTEFDEAEAAEIADEIAEAVRRALASIETTMTGQLPRLEDDLIDR